MSAYQGRFSGRTAVVTGGASGLGKAAAARIVAEGGKVVLWDLNAEALTAAADEVRAVHVIALDVADPEAVAAAAQASAQALDGRIDILNVHGQGGDDTIDASGLNAHIVLTLDGGDGNDVIHGSDFACNIVGGAGNDTLIGGAGDAHISGNDGDDMVQGEMGDDTLSGGAGNRSTIWKASPTCE